MHTTQLQEARTESRSNIFVMAALYADGRPVIPVRVRNISRMGALVEASSLPAIGATVRLSRASLSACGTLVWIDGAKGGVQFDSIVDVADWLPQGRRGFGQQFVDELFHQKRLGTARSIENGAAGFADELLELKLSLERAAEELALDGRIAARHLTTLQTIDSVGQALAKVAAEVALQDPPMATGTAG